jgi:hypothetical protein
MNVRLSWKTLPSTNPLAYCENLKSFLTLVSLDLLGQLSFGKLTFWRVVSAPSRNSSETKEKVIKNLMFNPENVSTTSSITTLRIMTPGASIIKHRRLIIYGNGHIS